MFTHLCPPLGAGSYSFRARLRSLVFTALAGLLAYVGVMASGLGLFPSAANAAELIMVERKGCAYCALWDKEISDIYPKTPEGAYAPLRRLDLHETRPTDVVFDGPLVLTPTFVLVEDGMEKSRIEGYGGDELFWAMLTVALRNHSEFTSDFSGNFVSNFGVSGPSPTTDPTGGN